MTDIEVLPKDDGGPYPVEQLGDDYDDGTMVESKQNLADKIVGHRIVSAERGKFGDSFFSNEPGVRIRLDNGLEVTAKGKSDCCAYTSVENILLHMNRIDHIITGIGTTDGYTQWHIYADLGDVLELSIDWSCGNPFYYGYGFEIDVVYVQDSVPKEIDGA